MEYSMGARRPMRVKTGPNAGVIVHVVDDGPHWNPMEDEINLAYVCCVMPDGRLGSIKIENLEEIR